VPLKIDQIQSFVVQLEGMRKRHFPIRGLSFYLSRKEGTYLLGPRQFGTTKHFQSLIRLSTLYRIKSALVCQRLIDPTKLVLAFSIKSLRSPEVLRSDRRFVGIGTVIFAVLHIRSTGMATRYYGLESNFRYQHKMRALDSLSGFIERHARIMRLDELSPQ